MRTLLLLQALSGHLDESLLNTYADSLNVPRPIVWAVAYMESRTGRQGNRVLGQGVLAYSNGHLKRVCRDIGRMQVIPCGPVPKLFPNRCSPALLRTSYADNVWCGVRFLRWLYDKYGTWEAAVWHYNGSQHYLALAKEYLGSLYFRSLKWDAATEAPKTYSR